MATMAISKRSQGRKRNANQSQRLKNSTTEPRKIKKPTLLLAF